MLSCIKYLQVLLSVKHDALSLDFSIFDIDFVTAEDNRYVFADADQISVPVGYVFVRYSGRNVKHDYSALSLNVVAVAKATKLLLASRVPDIEANRSTIGMKDQRMDLDSESGDILLLKFTGQMPLDEGSLASTTVADQHAFEGGHIGFVCHFDR